MYDEADDADEDGAPSLSDAGFDTAVADANASSGAGFDAAVDVTDGASTVPLNGDANGGSRRPFSAQGSAPTFAEISTIYIYTHVEYRDEGSMSMFTSKPSGVLLFQQHVSVSGCLQSAMLSQCDAQ